MKSRSQKIRRTQLWLVLFLSFPALLYSAPQGSPYTITDIGELAGPSLNSIATDINDRGRVIVDLSSAPLFGSGPDRAFLFQRGRTTYVATLGGASARPSSINRQGEFTGWSTTMSGDTHAFLWQDGWMSDLGTLGGSSGSVWGINDHADVVGQSGTGNGNHAFLHTDGQNIDLGTLGGPNSVAVAINNRRDVTGSSDTASGQTQAFLWQFGQMTELNIFNTNFAIASDVNQETQIVGEFFSQPTCAFHAFLWQHGHTIDLTPQLGAGGSCGIFATGLAIARSINDHEQVVGHYQIGGGGGSAFLWVDGQIADLNSLIPADSGWTIVDAFAINNKGQIVGFGYHGGGAVPQHAFLMTPSQGVPESPDQP